MRVLLLIATGLACCGCTTGYWVDRGRDASDIITATAGVGGGGSVRVGPVGLGFLYYNDHYGLRGGCAGDLRGAGESCWFIGPGIEQFKFAKARLRNKAYCSAIWFLNDGQKPIKRDGWPVGRAPGRSSCASMDLRGIENINAEGVAVIAAVVVAMCSVSLPMDPAYYPHRKYYHNHWAYYTQLEATFAAGGGFRFGVNLGECLDFLLGFIGKDLFGDDLERTTLTL